MMKTLLLDSSFFPIRVISWQKAMILFLTSRAEVVDEYEELQIKSPRECFNLPRILRLYSKHRGPKKVRFNRMNVYLRDDYTCQYCYQPYLTTELTFDHVVPQSKGGLTSWENIVTCCKDCNIKKANKTPREVNYKLLKEPIEPSWSPRLVLRLKDDDPVEWHQWLPGYQGV